MKRPLVPLMACTVLSAVPATTAYAQTASAPPAETPGVSGRADQASEGVSAEFLAIGEDGVATFALQNTNAIKVDPSYVDDRTGRKGRKVERQHWRISASAPIGDGEDLTDIGTLDALASGFKFEVNFARSTSKLLFPDDAQVDKWVDEAKANCLAAQSANLSADPQTHCALEQAKGDIFVRRYLRNGAALLNSHIHRGTIKYGATAAVGYDKFSFRDPSTLLESSDKKVSFEGSAFLTYLFPTSFTSLTGQVKYQSGYKATDSKILCPVNPTNTVIECFNDPAGPPTKNNGIQLAADLRHYFGPVLGVPMAISPQVTYDVSDNVVGLDVPIYFVGDGKGGLTGGIRAGWRSDTDKVVVGIFVGTRFGHSTD